MKPYYDEGGITIYHGDCREVLPTLEAGSVDAVVTDPPYGIGFSRYLSHDDNPADYEELIRFVVLESQRLVKPGGLVFMWQAMKNAGKWHEWFPSGWRVFAALRNFTQFLPSPVQYSWDPVIFWTVGRCATKGVAGQRDYHMGNTAKYVAEKSIGHPCPRPLDTATYIVALVSEQGGYIIDPFMGSGTTLRAAKDLGRRAIGIEIEERYCEIAVKRLQQMVLPLGV